MNPAKRCHYTAINSAPRSSRSAVVGLLPVFKEFLESTIGTKTRTQLVSELDGNKDAASIGLP